MARRRIEGAGATPTLEDVAQEAGVSVATVSRVLNSPAVVREATKARVEAAVARTGYTPNFAGRALALNRTMTVGAVIPTLNNAIFAHGVNAFEAALRARGYTLLLAVSNYDADAEHANVVTMIERGVDALMLVGTDHAPATIERLRKARRPFVCSWSYAPHSDLPTVGFDNHGAMARVIAHLADLGHTQIGMIAGITAGNDRARDRVRGVHDALLARGLALRPDRLVEVRYSVEAASACASAMLSAAAPPTAIICGNDVIAYGALFAAAAAGRRVPQDVSVAGFDDLSLSAHMPPGLTTVRVPAVRMGEAAANHLADRVEGVANESAAAIELPTTLIERGTTGPAPAVSTGRPTGG